MTDRNSLCGALRHLARTARKALTDVRQLDSLLGEIFVPDAEIDQYVNKLLNQRLSHCQRILAREKPIELNSPSADTYITGSIGDPAIRRKNSLGIVDSE